MEELTILGRQVLLRQRSKAQLKGINIGESLSYIFYDGEYLGESFLFLQPKDSKPTPRECSIVANRMYLLFGLPVVFILESAPYYERQRLIDKNVYFVMGDKFAFLPMLVANERIRNQKKPQRLTPVAQYLLLYHLQVESLEGLSAMEMSSKFPYSYESITLGLSCLEDLLICKKSVGPAKQKIVHFLERGRTLWVKAQKYLLSPVEKRIYCDDLFCQGRKFSGCGINALAHYSRLLPDDIKMLMMTKKDFKELEDSKSFRNANEFDGNFLIEVWKYPVVAPLGALNDWVDKLSLALSLRDDDDARVEGEVERVINEIEWKD